MRTLQKCVLTGIGLLTGVFAALGATIDPSNYNYMMPFTPKAGKVTGTLSNFPILVRLSAARHQNFNPADCGENGANLRFALENGTVLAHEIDTWNADGESLVWVNVPELTDQTKIIAYWGVKDASAAPTVNPEDTWPDFVAVYHLGEGGTTAYDSSGNNYTAVLSEDGSVSLGSSPKVGGCANVSGMFKASDTALQEGVKPLDWSKFTISAWTAFDAWNANGNSSEYIVIARKMSSWGDKKGGFLCRYFPKLNDVRGYPFFALISNNTKETVNWGTTLKDYASAGKWQYMTCTVNGSTSIKYIDGVEKDTKSDLVFVEPSISIPLEFGVAKVDGFAARIDELRIRNGAASAEWIKADYEQQDSSSFLNYGLVGGAFAIAPLADMSVTPEELLAGICPAVFVSNQVAGVELVLGADYTVSYLNNTSFGIATAVATGINSYAGMTCSTSFRIDCVKNVSANYNLSADEDWSFAERVNVASGMTIDLKGHRLAISGLEGTGKITDTIGGGVLEFIVPASYISGNYSTIASGVLNGKLKLVKKGPGLLVNSQSQNYTGGTDILDGMLRVNVPQKHGPSALGPATEVRKNNVYLGPGGAFDPMGSQGWGYHNFVIGGGTISNSVENYMFTHSTDKPNPYIFNPITTIDGDFSFVTSGSYYWYIRNLNGHKVSIDIGNGKTLCVYANANSGTISVIGGGTLRTYTGYPASFYDVDLELIDSKLSLDAEMTVRNYKVVKSGKSGTGSATLSVFGTFTPLAENFYAPTMQNGSAIDLSSKTEAWNMQSTSFATGAKVNIELGERKVKKGEMIIEWSQKPDSLVTFKNTKWNLEVRDDGLYVLGKKGFCVIVH